MKRFWDVVSDRQQTVVMHDHCPCVSEVFTGTAALVFFSPIR